MPHTPHPASDTHRFYLNDIEWCPCTSSPLPSLAITLIMIMITRRLTHVLVVVFGVHGPQCFRYVVKQWGFKVFLHQIEVLLGVLQLLCGEPIGEQVIFLISCTQNVDAVFLNLEKKVGYQSYERHCTHSCMVRAVIWRRKSTMIMIQRKTMKYRQANEIGRGRDAYLFQACSQVWFQYKLDSMQLHAVNLLG